LLKTLNRTLSAPFLITRDTKRDTKKKVQFPVQQNFIRQSESQITSKNSSFSFDWFGVLNDLAQYSNLLVSFKNRSISVREIILVRVAQEDFNKPRTMSL